MLLFTVLLQFIYGFISPKYKLSPKPEEEIPRILKSIGYPFLISRTSMFAIGSLHTWPHILVALTFLIELINYGMAIGEHMENMMFPPDDDGFDSDTMSEAQYFTRHKFLGAGGIDGLIEENNALEQQLELLEKDPDHLKAANQRLQLLQHDDERLVSYLNELETHKRQQEQQLTEVEELCANLAIELESENAKVLKMQLMYENQEFTQEDVERINMRTRELERQKADIEKNIQAVDEDIWKEEIGLSKEVEQIQSKCQAYNKLAHSLKLIPITAENSSGIDYELKKTAYTDGTLSNFQDIIKPALITLKQQCADTANRQNSEKIKVKEQLEQASEYVSDLQNEVGLLESKYKRAEDEVEAKKQMYLKEIQRMQECVEELQNEMVHLESVMFLSQQDASTEKKKLDSWSLQEREKARRKLEQHKNFLQEALQTFMEHMENMQAKLAEAHEDSEALKEKVRQEASAKGIE
ncbi:kinetochore protein NDC80 homolog [Ruditapes philippinarum]|uniref:kinetochore protein NDC80 homolog n=1 Tax=Ruditapes philippinarum TaxID=129788 RepID=UPI00295AD0D9|nr:kinetochore protein NDC80 homolog [Ruditapes philippinarum]